MLFLSCVWEKCISAIGVIRCQVTAVIRDTLLKRDAGGRFKEEIELPLLLIMSRVVRVSFIHVENQQQESNGCHGYVSGTEVLRCRCESQGGEKNDRFGAHFSLDSSRLEVLLLSFSSFSDCIRSFALILATVPSALAAVTTTWLFLFSLVRGTNVHSTSCISSTLRSSHHHSAPTLPPPARHRQYLFPLLCCSTTTQKLLSRTKLRHWATDHQLETRRRTDWYKDLIEVCRRQSRVGRKECLICSGKSVKKVCWSQLAGPVTKQSRRNRTAGLTCSTTITDNSGLGVRAGAGRLFPGFGSRAARRRCHRWKGSPFESSVAFTSPSSILVHQFYSPTSSPRSASSFTATCTSSAAAPLTVFAAPNVPSTGFVILLPRTETGRTWVEWPCLGLRVL